MSIELDDVYHQLHRFGPEFGADEEGNHGLTNHGPMAAEVIVRRGLDVHLGRWIDRYQQRLAKLPTAHDAIDDWRTALGDARRLPDWDAYFARQLNEQPWTDVLATWWPRLLPGIIAGSTHGVIRVGHAVRALHRPGAPSPQNLYELAHGLAFWAARYRPIATGAVPAGNLDARLALQHLTRLPERTGRIADRLARLEASATWSADIATLHPVTDPSEVPAALADLIGAAVGHYARFGQDSPVLLVHTATAPNAVLHTLPDLPEAMWIASLNAAWTASAAVMAGYASTRPLTAPTSSASIGAATVLDRAAHHGDEHVIKFADTAVEAFDRVGDPLLLTAAVHASKLITRPA